MTSKSLAINFLETYYPWKQLQEFDSLHFKGQNRELHAYQSLTDEYEQFLQDQYLDNIMIVITGIDNTLFSTNSENYLMGNAYQRLKSPIFGDRLSVNEGESQLYALWFPSAPIKIKNYEWEEEVIRKNITNYFISQFGLMVSDVSLSIITDGSGWETFFYERCFLPKRFLEITGINEHSHQDTHSEDEITIMRYILEGKTKLLESLVRNQLNKPLDFRVQLPDPFIPSDSTALFMPFFSVCLKIASDTTATSIIHLVSQKFELLECYETNGNLKLVCRTHEGPFAENVSDIVTNIRELLGPHVMQHFSEHNLELESVSFILTETEY